MTTLEDCRKLQNAPLLAETLRLARAGDAILADLLAHLAEVNRRELHLEEGFRSLFAYCVKGLGFSEGETHNRIYTARAVARFPAILPMIREGRLRMSSVVRLAKHLTPDNHMALLEEACGKTIEEVDMMVARLAPKPDRPDVVRRVCAPAPVAALEVAPDVEPETAPTIEPENDPAPAFTSTTVPNPAVSLATSAGLPEPRPAPRQRMTPLAPERVHISFTASAATADKIKRARARLRRRFPEGRLEDLVEAAFEALLEREDPVREPEVRRAPRPASPKSRAVPAAVRREVWRRDGGRCSYAAPSGRRCDARERLEFDHIVPWSAGGSADATNIRLLCRAHNLKRARARFGTDKVPRRELRIT